MKLVIPERQNHVPPGYGVQGPEPVLRVYVRPELPLVRPVPAVIVLKGIAVATTFVAPQKLQAKPVANEMNVKASPVVQKVLVRYRQSQVTPAPL